jgi:hypothetical protein
MTGEAKTASEETFAWEDRSAGSSSPRRTSTHLSTITTARSAHPVRCLPDTILTDEGLRVVRMIGSTRRTNAGPS